MQRIAAIVEGHTEYHFIRATYGNSIVGRGIPNGKNVQVSLIVETISDWLDTIGGEIKDVIILLDREERTLSAAQLSASIYNAVSTKFPGRNIHVGVTDKHVENWILADENKIRAMTGNPNYAYPGDGIPGKPVFENVTGKRFVGPNEKALILKSCSARNAAGNSPSLAAFLKQITFPWHWTTT